MPRGGVHNPGITPASICFADPSRRDIKQKHTNNRPFNAIKATSRVEQCALTGFRPVFCVSNAPASRANLIPPFLTTYGATVIFNLNR